MLEMLLQNSETNQSNSQVDLGNIGNLVSDAAAQFRMNAKENEGIRVYQANQSEPL